MDIKIEPIIAAAEEAGKVIRNYFGAMLEIEEKSTLADVRTQADTEAEAIILKKLHEHFPDFGVYSEETGKIKNDSPYQFVIDPLDGSNNFILGIPQFSVSIAVVSEDQILAGVVHHPILKKTYHARKDQGAYIENVRLHVSTETDVKRATMAHTCGYRTPKERINGVLSELHSYGAKRILRNWAVALDFCLLADGKIEAVINDGSEEYDYMAGRLIAQEAGAIICDFNGRGNLSSKENVFMAANTAEIRDLLTMHIGSNV